MRMARAPPPHCAVVTCKYTARVVLVSFIHIIYISSLSLTHATQSVDPGMPVSAPVSRSPSPAAAPPIAATPGPRAANLIKLYNDAVSHTLKTCNYPNFAACFPTPAQHAPEAMEGFHREFVEKLGEHCRVSRCAGSHGRESFITCYECSELTACCTTSKVELTKTYRNTSTTL